MNMTSALAAAPPVGMYASSVSNWLARRRTREASWLFSLALSILYAAMTLSLLGAQSAPISLRRALIVRGSSRVTVAAVRGFAARPQRRHRRRAHRNQSIDMLTRFKVR